MLNFGGVFDYICIWNRFELLAEKKGHELSRCWFRPLKLLIFPVSRLVQFRLGGDYPDWTANNFLHHVFLGRSYKFSNSGKTGNLWANSWSLARHCGRWSSPVRHVFGSWYLSPCFDTLLQLKTKFIWNLQTGKKVNKLYTCFLCIATTNLFKSHRWSLTVHPWRNDACIGKWCFDGRFRIHRVLRLVEIGDRRNAFLRGNHWKTFSKLVKILDPIPLEPFHS